MKNETKTLIAREIIANFKLIGYAFILTIVFFIVFYFVNKPEIVDTATIERIKAQASNRVHGVSEIGSNEYGSNVIGMGSIGSCKYDVGISSSNVEYVNVFRKERFKSDIISKTSAALPIAIFVLIFGRYLFKLRKWTIRNAKL